MRVMDGLLMTHVPIHPDSMGRFRANIHGHVHNNEHLAFPYVNVCVEVTSYAPVPLEFLRDVCTRKRLEVASAKSHPL